MITEHQAALVDRLVAGGRYQNASEVLREGLRLVERQWEDHERRLATFDAAIAEGETAYARGEYMTIESEEDLQVFMRSLDDED